MSVVRLAMSITLSVMSDNVDGLPAYAVSGKVLTPIPVFRWERGQRLSQTLMDLQLPLYERMMEQAPKRLTTMIVSGDVYIRAAERLGTIPDADVARCGSPMTRCFPNCR